MKSPATASTNCTRVVGVYAYSKPGKVFLYEEACVVGGSEGLMKKYLALLTGDIVNMKISKIRFGLIHDGLEAGAVYAFDRLSYQRFYPLARQAGIDDLDGFPSTSTAPDDLHLMKVKLKQS